jgi:hypothetical protein
VASKTVAALHTRGRLLVRQRALQPPHADAPKPGLAPTKAKNPPINAVAKPTFFITPLPIFSSSFMFASKTSFDRSFRYTRETLGVV